MDMTEHIESILKREFDPEFLKIQDQSQDHQGHAGMARGGAHLKLLIVSSKFEGISELDRHRMIYKLLAEEINQGDIHALAIDAISPNEWQTHES